MPRSAKETGKPQPLVVIGRDASPAPMGNEFQVGWPSENSLQFLACLERL